MGLRAVLLRIMAIRAPRSFQGALWLPCLVLLLFFIAFTYASPPWRPRLGALRGYKRAKNSVYNPSLVASDSNKNYQTFYYDQTLDHFNYQPVSYTTYRERYVVNFKHWRGAKVAAPRFAYLGEESSLDEDIGSIGFMTDNQSHMDLQERKHWKMLPFAGTLIQLKL